MQRVFQAKPWRQKVLGFGRADLLNIHFLEGPRGVNRCNHLNVAVCPSLVGSKDITESSFLIVHRVEGIRDIHRFVDFVQSAPKTGTEAFVPLAGFWFANVR